MASSSADDAQKPEMSFSQQARESGADEIFYQCQSGNAKRVVEMLNDGVTPLEDNPECFIVRDNKSSKLLIRSHPSHVCHSSRAGRRS